MTTKNTLPQLSNTVEIVGTLKELDLKEATSKKGNKYVKGTVTVVSNADNKVHEHKISVMVMATSKLYKGIQTMMNEYKSIEAVGEADADRIRVTGEIDLEEYYSKNDDNLRSYNKIKGVFFNRLEEGKDQPDKALATIEVVVKAFTPVDIEGEVIHYGVKAFTVGYGERIIELKKAIVSLGLADAMQNLYQPGTTGRLTFKINNYVEKVEKEAVEQVSVAHGFGSEETVEANRIFNKFTSNLEITGGDVPYEEPKALSAEQIQDADRKLALSREALKQNRQAPETPQKPTGFGGDITLPTGMDAGPTSFTTPTVPSTPNVPAGVSPVDDMPDF